MARANDPQDDKTMRMRRPELELDDEQTMRMPLPDWDDEKTIRVARHDLGEDKTIRVQRAQDDWESTVRAPLAALREPGMVILPLDDPHDQPTIRMPRPVSQAAAPGKAVWPPADPALHAAAASTLREMPKVPQAPPLSRKLMWSGLAVVSLVLAAVAWMLIKG